MLFEHLLTGLLSMHDLLLPHSMNALKIFWVLFGRILMKKQVSWYKVGIQFKTPS